MSNYVIHLQKQGGIAGKTRPYTGAGFFYLLGYI